MTEGYELAYLIGGLFLSLTAFSLIFGDNYLFRLGAAVLSGAVSAYVCVLLAESYFYPLVLELADGAGKLTMAQMIRAAAVIIGIVLLFCRAYTASKTGGRIVLTVLLAVSAAVMVLGAAGGTIAVFVRSLAGQFRLVSLTDTQKSSFWYWGRTGILLITAVSALFFTRHYSLGKKDGEKENGSAAGSVLVGFAFGAVAAGIFLAAANILVNHVSGLIGTIQTLLK